MRLHYTGYKLDEYNVKVIGSSAKMFKRMNPLASWRTLTHIHDVKSKSNQSQKDFSNRTYNLPSFAGLVKRRKLIRMSNPIKIQKVILRWICDLIFLMMRTAFIDSGFVPKVYDWSKEWTLKCCFCNIIHILNKYLNDEEDVQYLTISINPSQQALKLQS